VLHQPKSSLIKQLFDIDPDWVEVIYDNQGLQVWEGGCTWIEEDQITVQLRKRFLNKESYLGYSRDEIIAHELVHVVRGAFKEPVYEEILAYQTSSSALRRFLGPLFRAPKESYIFLGSLVAYYVSMCVGVWQMPFLFIFLALSACGLLRLLKAQMTFHRARKNLNSLVQKKDLLAVMLRLTDEEINRFSKMNRQQILTYATQMATTHLRWQQIIPFLENKTTKWRRVT
jgi:hypothetical protein